MIRYDYVLGVPIGGTYNEVVNTDSDKYGGSNVGNLGLLAADDIAAHGRPYSLRLTLPPLTTLILSPA